MKGGELDVLQLPRFRAGFRQIASDINAGIQRVVEKGGGTARKPADLESILGPVPAQPSMSAFSFPMPDGSAATQAPNMGTGPAFNAPGGPSQSGSNNRFNAPPPQAAPSRPNAGPGPQPAPPPVGSRPGMGGTPGPGVPMAPGMPQQPFTGNERTMAMQGAPPPHGGFGAPPPMQAPAAGASPQAQKLALQATAPAPFPPGGKGAKDEDEQTMVAQPSADLIAATGGHAAAQDPAAEWHQVYEEFLRTKRECNEPTDGLTFEKFQQTLKKNRDALMQRHGCKRVKFSVYVKEGRASLKATPVRD
jgi:hypothetical protein